MSMKIFTEKMILITSWVLTPPGKFWKNMLKNHAFL